MGRFLAKAGGSAAPGEIGAEFGLNRARQADVLGDLEQAGLIERTRVLVKLARAGWARFGGVGPGQAGVVLDRLLSAWPAPHHAFLSLMHSAVIARWHLAEAHPGVEHLSFLTLGETGTGKTSMGEVLCRNLGLDFAVAYVFTPGETAGSLLGRREPAEGGGRRWIEAPRCRQPFVVLDEFDKVRDAETERAVLRYLQGRVRQEIEGDRHRLRPTPLVTANPQPGDRLGIYRPEYRRRAVVMDTGFMAGRARDIEDMLTDLFERADPGECLPLDRLQPPTRLDPDARAVLRTVSGCLTELGRGQFPGIRALELAALGRCALYGPEADHVVAALGTAIDYLIVTSTLPGQVEPGWGTRVGAVRDHLGAGGQADLLAAAIDRAQRVAAEQHASAHRNRRRQAQADLTLLAEAAAMQTELRQARDDLDGRRVPREHKSQAAYYRRPLDRLIDRAGHVSTAAGLDDLRADAAQFLDGAQALRITIDQARAQAQRERDDAERARRELAQMEREQRQIANAQAQWAMRTATQARRQDRESLAAVVAEAKPLERLWQRTATRPGENPLTALAAVRIDGSTIIHFRPDDSDSAKGFLRQLAAVMAPGWGTWEVVGSAAAFRGTREHYCPELSEWGRNTRAVISPVLTHLHEAEDQLRQRVGATPRSGRPTLSTRAVRPPQIAG